MNWPMMKENTLTPNIRIIEASHRSLRLTGWKSPYPIVDRVVIAKYHTFTSFVMLLSWS